MTMTPVPGCLVRSPDGAQGLVSRCWPESDPAHADIHMAGGATRTCPIGDLRSGTTIGREVWVQGIGSGPPPGFGKVQALRTLAGHEQVLVQFALSGETRWLPFETLRDVMPIEARMRRGAIGSHPDHAERVRLRTLGQALSSWAANTGAFGSLDLDPLPHQTRLAHKVVASGTPGWLIADDVGLGKTIEIGLILNALAQRGRCRRVLVLCPSSLTLQWQGEMRNRFANEYAIYGRDFTPAHPDQLRLQNHVLISMDLAKQPNHLSMLLQGGDWDVVVFDEAHRLGVSETGERTARYALALALRPLARKLLLTTATPHQGKSRRFAALLKLVRPDLHKEIDDIALDPSVVGKIVIRNRKTQVTDGEGNLLFCGHDTIRKATAPSIESMTFDAALRDYLRHGYAVGTRGGTEGRAIGFVMTIYRKLASSSTAAILQALRRRLGRLQSDDVVSQSSLERIIDLGELDDDDAPDTRADLFGGRAFFEDEAVEVASLIRLAETALETDAKRACFLNDIARPLLEKGERLLVFTEYRATQDWIVEALLGTFEEAVATINGSQSIEEKTEAVAAFTSGDARVMVSTEAGGEGLNLQQACAVMVNYDLPWNPSRLVQRIGRLYRYGQMRRVQVINLQQDDGFDAQVLGLMLERVRVIAAELASVSPTDAETLAAEILGDLLSNIDMEEILSRADMLSVTRTEAEIELAIADARSAREAEIDILQYAESLDGADAAILDRRHLVSFVAGMAPSHDIIVTRADPDAGRIDLELPPNLIGVFAEFGRRSRLTFTMPSPGKTNAAPRDAFRLDISSPFIRRLLSEASGLEFDGRFGTASDPGVPYTAVRLRWQDGDGEMLDDLLTLLEFHADGHWTRMDPRAVSDALLAKTKSATTGTSRSEAEVAALGLAMERLLAAECSASRFPARMDAITALSRAP